MAQNEQGTAPSPSGKARACKAFIGGSIPPGASSQVALWKRPLDGANSAGNSQRGFDYMRWQGITLLAKKILLGVALTLAPLAILFGGLRLTQQVLDLTTHGGQSQLSAK